jgi:hypothetical protein
MHDQEYYERFFIRRQRNMLQKTMIGVVTRVTEVMMPNIMRGGGRGQNTGRQVLERIKLPVLLQRRSSHQERRSFSEELKGSKSMEQFDRG